MGSGLTPIPSGLTALQGLSPVKCPAEHTMHTTPEHTADLPPGQAKLKSSGGPAAAPQGLLAALTCAGLCPGGEFFLQVRLGPQVLSWHLHPAYLYVASHGTKRFLNQASPTVERSFTSSDPIASAGANPGKLVTQQPESLKEPDRDRTDKQ